jgi:hypothetical protein
MAHLLV